MLPEAISTERQELARRVESKNVPVMTAVRQGQRHRKIADDNGKIKTELEDELWVRGEVIGRKIPIKNRVNPARNQMGA